MAEHNSANTNLEKPSFLTTSRLANSAPPGHQSSGADPIEKVCEVLEAVLDSAFASNYTCPLSSSKAYSDFNNKIKMILEIVERGDKTTKQDTDELESLLEAFLRDIGYFDAPKQGESEGTAAEK